MRALLIGVSALVLMSSAASAQQPAERMSATATQPARFLVFFNLDDATLTPEGAQVVSRAADEYKRTGAAKVAAHVIASPTRRPRAFGLTEIHSMSTKPSVTCAAEVPTGSPSSRPSHMR